MRFTLLMRLTVGNVAILLLVILLGIYVSFNLNHLNRLIRGTAGDGTTISQMENLREALFSQASFEKKFFIAFDGDYLKKYWELHEILVKYLIVGASRMDTPRKKKLFAEARQLYDEYVALFKAETDLIARGKKTPGIRNSRRNDEILDGIHHRMTQIITLVGVDRENKLQSSSDISIRIFEITVFTGVLIVAFGILISFLTSRSINRSIVLLQRKTKEIANGNYIKIPSLRAPPEILELAEDFNHMSAKLKKLDEMKIDFINHVSHELRTPLTAIKEASGMLLEGTYQNSPDKQLQLLTITKEECDRLIGSVNRLLDHSRIEAKMMEYRFKKCSLAPVMQRSVLKLAPIARGKKIRLELIPLPELPSVRIDEERIGQVMENLIGNALKFTSEKGQITIQATRFNRDKRFIGIAVTDTGAGITAEGLEVIFNKFSRIESGGQTTPGSGLGLAITKHIIEDHGGEIWVKSEPGKGSTFFFVLPVA